MPRQEGRLIALPGVHNVRDLGGYPMADGGTTRWRAILRSDDLARLVAPGVARLVELGLRTVIDLRNPSEIAQRPNPFQGHEGVAYHNVSLFAALVPIAPIDADGEPFDMPKRYRRALDRSQDQLSRVLRLIADAEPGMVLFHCSAGKDRTGIVAALLLALVGVDGETVVADYALTATVAAPLLAELRDQSLARGADPVWVERYLASDPETMRNALAHLKAAYGGVEAYMAALGISDSLIGRIRRRVAGNV